MAILVKIGNSCSWSPPRMSCDEIIGYEIDLSSENKSEAQDVQAHRCQRLESPSNSFDQWRASDETSRERSTEAK